MNRTTNGLCTLRDLGGAAWLGGALMGATGLNAAGDAAGADRDAVVSAGWARWTPVLRAAALAHLAGGVGSLATRPSRSGAVGLGLSASAAGAVAGTAVLGARKGADRAVHALEWLIPALLAGALVTNARR